MRDMGRSDDPRVQAQLDRLSGLSIQRDTLGLDAIRELLSRLGDPHKRLPPVFHVAGTNGKGSTCAFLRAMLEAEGYQVHVTTSPHLVRYNERFRIADKLIEDARLAELLEQVFDAAEGLGCSFFEITIAAAFVEFARIPADACVVEVGLGGRLDATNVLEPDVLAACGIAALGIDHERFLLAPEDGVPKEPMARIAFEKAGIAKKGVPLVTQWYPEEQHEAVADQSEKVGARLIDEGRLWNFGQAIGRRVGYNDANGAILLPPPALLGEHQYANCALAAAMIRHQDKIEVSLKALKEGAANAAWPARMQRLSPGQLIGERQVILDGGHNPSAGAQIAMHFDGPLHLILGMLDNKDPTAITGPLGNRIRTLTIVPVPGHESHPVEAFGPEARAAQDVEEALLNIPNDDFPILIAGSLYLAGEVLRLNDEIPD
ncbi:bifunctional folylpolyglutamate synthase/dihydrofolate synthase [Altererythrobacter lutimaris]|uniref:Bifunctional folylpolyglutamate synthase/dihydrofolate synthase n=1 Tax=Altererythrobacter lutimaris TaxID=2743979 RepID=A0A850H8C1_9SPHN|nr:folylpolyglutamate synthase/dihydrofolate synthase family protein [Altererythrobacter lutimaris]NVE93780.1 bifunctional folylpolyglutamate synthase/dihydrofolate synthase [Altererythrobacter lutimaris]